MTNLSHTTSDELAAVDMNDSTQGQPDTALPGDIQKQLDDAVNAIGHALAGRDVSISVGALATAINYVITRSEIDDESRRNAALFIVDQAGITAKDVGVPRAEAVSSLEKWL